MNIIRLYDELWRATDTLEQGIDFCIDTLSLTCNDMKRNICMWRQRRRACLLAAYKDIQTPHNVCHIFFFGVL